MKKNRVIVRVLAGAILSCLLGIVAFSVNAEASEASAVAIGVTDYEANTMEIIKNGNSIIYSSINNKKTWETLDETVVDDKMTMNIDFPGADKSKNVEIWFKGDKDTKVVKVVIPKQSNSFKVKYDKATGSFEMSGYDDRTQFRWRKSSDYNYKTVDINPNSASYKAFCKEIEALTIKGAKICIGLAGKNGTGIDDMGARPSNEVLITIPKKASAPSIKLSPTKSIFNTRETMEYQVLGSGSAWKTCKKNMTIAEIAPEVLVENGAKNVAIKFRYAATSSKPASLECFVTVKAQRTGPSIGASEGVDVIVKRETVKDKKGKEKTKTIITFATTSKEKPIEYCIVKPGDTLNLSKGWTAGKNGKTVQKLEKACPKGSVIYVRYKGINANANKGIEAEIPSAYATYTVG
ncbi:MAG: hypothetical protein IK138_05100 [Lachnospiraceae bacterium]|nr:hypothetical protein [Lachnospiraceae bacterium]